MLPSPDPTPPRTRPRPLSILLVLLPLALMVVGVAIVELSMHTEPAGSANAEGTTGTRPGAPIPSPAPAESTPAAPTAGSSAQNSQAAASPRDGAPSQPSGVVPPTPWLSLPADTTLTRIAVGSCLDQAKPQPIWQAIAEATPQLMLVAGDNVYGDVRGNDITPLVDAYRRQLAHPQFAAARRTLPVLGIWDDHDYGRNDAGVELAAKTETAQLFREFWQLEPASQPAEAGVYYSRMFGPADRRVQILFLDTRTFRAPLKTKTDTFPHWGKYEPDPDPTKTMLGDAQWAWPPQLRGTRAGSVDGPAPTPTLSYGSVFPHTFPHP